MLVEVVGLSKMLEVASTVFISQRPQHELQKHHQVTNGKMVPAARTTLIVVPNRSLCEWVLAFERFIPLLVTTVYKGVNCYPRLGNRPLRIAEYLLSHDVVFASYDIIALELDHGRYSFKQRYSWEGIKRLGEDSKSATKRSRPTELMGIPQGSLYSELSSSDDNDSNNETPKERGLPLMDIQFWRVVVDRCQTTRSIYEETRVLQFVALVPRHHTWCVVVFPLKFLLEDLHLHLSILQCPAFNDSKPVWDILKSCPLEFVRFFSSLAICHTYVLVFDQITPSVPRSSMNP